MAVAELVAVDVELEVDEPVDDSVGVIDRKQGLIPFVHIFTMHLRVVGTDFVTPGNDISTVYWGV